MVRYLLRRVFSSLIALFVFLTFMFFVVQAMIPGDFTTQFSQALTAEEREELRSELGIDQPLFTQYVRWMGHLVRGDLGRSLYGFPVVQQLKNVIPYTLLVFLTGTLLAFLLGLWLGKVVAWQGSGILTGATVTTAISLYTAFPPWLAFLVTYFFARRLNMARDPFSYGKRLGGATHWELGVWYNAPLSPQQVALRAVVSFIAVAALLFLIDSLMQRQWKRRLPVPLALVLFLGGVVGSWHAFGFAPLALDIMIVAGIPIITYVLLSFGETMLIMRTSMIDTLKEEYVLTAQAKGLPDRVVRNRHAARNALLPVLSRFVVSFPYMLTGLVIIEDTLDWPGISKALFDALYQQDMPVVMGALLLVGVLSAVARLALDVVAAYLDPRIRFDAAHSWRL
ncbi:MAG: ABC transporter permease [Anaerolineales bacterium]